MDIQQAEFSAEKKRSDVFSRLGLGEFPIILAPLAGVSDHPFRRVCARQGAQLTYVEMISAAALVHSSERTFGMLKRHESESILGVQITGRSAEEVAEAIGILDSFPFETIDINMGCPVQKVVKSGCGSAILKDPERVYATVKAARARTAKPLSVKVRLGWDHASKNVLQVAEAAESAGAEWITVHGRTRSDDYGDPVDLGFIGKVRQQCRIPVIGNGNLFHENDAAAMRQNALVDGVMVSRGALGNPWIFRDLAKYQATGFSESLPVSLDEWLHTVLDHLDWHAEEHGSSGVGAITMRKHLLWYLKGWPGAKLLKEDLLSLTDLIEVRASLLRFSEKLAASGTNARFSLDNQPSGNKFLWDPKWEMDRGLDRGVGTDGLDS